MVAVVLIGLPIEITKVIIDHRKITVILWLSTSLLIGIMATLGLVSMWLVLLPTVALLAPVLWMILLMVVDPPNWKGVFHGN